MVFDLYAAKNSPDPWLAGSTPFAMPVGQAHSAQRSFFGPYDPYQAQDENQYRDMLAQTQRFNGTPTYQQDQNFMPTMSPEVKALWDKRQAYNAMSEADKMHARTTGNGFFNNADSGELLNLTVGNKSIDNQMRADINDWTRRFNNQIATNILNQDNGNRPNNSKMWASDVLNNKAWVGNINSNTAVAPGTGTQFGRTLDSLMHRGIDPGERLRQQAKTRDFFSNEFGLNNAQALQTNSGTKDGSGMAGQGSGNYQSFSVTGPMSNQDWNTKWGNRGGGLAGENNWGGGVSSMPQRAPNDPWGTPEAYARGYHAPAPFKNNSLLASNSQQPGISTGVRPGASQPSYWDGPNGARFNSGQFTPLPLGGGVPSVSGGSGPGGSLRPVTLEDQGIPYLRNQPDYVPQRGGQSSAYQEIPQMGTWDNPSPNAGRDPSDPLSANPFSNNPYLISSADHVINQQYDVFSNAGNPSWNQSGQYQYPARTTNPNYRPAGFMPWYTQINPFTAGQILGQLGMRS